MLWSSAKNFKGYYYLLLCCIFDQVFSELFLGKCSWLLFWRISQVYGWELIFLFSSSKEGRAPFWIWEEGEKCDLFNGQVLLWNSWIWEDSRSCATGIFWKGETLRNCFFCFCNSVLREISSFKAGVCLKMRLLPVAVRDALNRNVCQGRTGEGQKKAGVVWLPDSRCSAEAYLPSVGGLFPKAFKWLRSTRPTDFQSSAKHCCRARFTSSFSSYLSRFSQVGTQEK